MASHDLEDDKEKYPITTSSSVASLSALVQPELRAVPSTVHPALAQTPLERIASEASGTYRNRDEVLEEQKAVETEGQPKLTDQTNLLPARKPLSTLLSLLRHLTFLYRS